MAQAIMLFYLLIVWTTTWLTRDYTEFHMIIKFSVINDFNILAY